MYFFDSLLLFLFVEYPRKAEGFVGQMVYVYEIRFTGQKIANKAAALF
jgi:hypothetical protein